MYLFRRGAGISAVQGTNSVELMARAFAEKGQEGRNQVQLELWKTEMTDVLAGPAVQRARHNLVHLGMSTWERDVFAFLDQYLQK